jgi:hypothetical protein
MNTRPSKEYRYIFTTAWKQASTSHLSSRLTDNASGKILTIFILTYLFVLPTSFLRIPKTHNRTSLQIWMQMYWTFFLLVNQHFLGLPASGTHFTLPWNSGQKIVIVGKSVKRNFRIALTYLSQYPSFKFSIFIGSIKIFTVYKQFSSHFHVLQRVNHFAFMRRAFTHV